ncbi:MAG: hypothetical protein ABI880_02895 [Acidobacteriota bacterium]
MPRLIARQTSLWNAFSFDLLGEQRRVVGNLAWPRIAQATNARVRVLPEGSPDGGVTLTCERGRFHIPFTYASRGWTNDVRFELVSADGRTLASAESVANRTGRNREFQISAPFTGVLRHTARLARHRFVVERDGTVVGTAAEPRAVSVRREVHLDLTVDVETPVQGFFLFLALHMI